MERRSALAVAALATLLGIIGNSTAIVQPLLVGVMVESYGLSSAQAGMVSAAEMTAFGIGAFAVAGLVARGDRRGLVLVFLGLAVAGNVASSLAATIDALIPSRIVAGIGTGAALALSGAFVAGLRAPDRIYSLITVAVLIYAGLFLTFVPQLMLTTGAAAPFITLAGLAMLALPVAAVAAPTARSIGLSRPARPAPRPAAVMPLLAAALLLYAGHGAVWTYEERMGVAIGMSVAEVGAALGLASIAGIIGAAAAGVVGLRWGRTWPQVIALGVSALAAVLIVTAQTPDSYRVGASLIAVAWFFGLPYLNGLAASLDKHGRIAALVAAMLNLGTAAGPFLAALIIGNGYLVVGLLAGTFYLVCLMLILPLSIRSDRDLGGSGPGAAGRPVTEQA